MLLEYPDILNIYIPRTS